MQKNKYAIYSSVTRTIVSTHRTIEGAARASKIAACPALMQRETNAVYEDFRDHYAPCVDEIAHRDFDAARFDFARKRLS